MLVAVLVAFLGGIALASCAPFSTALGWAVLFVCAAVAVFIRSRHSAIVFSVCVFAFIGGMARFYFADRPAPIERFAGTEQVLSGYVDGDFAVSTTGGRFPFRVARVGDDAVGGRVLVQTDAFPERRLGEKLVLTGALQAPQSWDDFDYVSYLKKDGIRLIVNRPEISAAGAVPLGLVEHGWLVVRKALTSVRDAMAGAVGRAVPEPAAAYLNGILLGLRQDIPQDLKDAFSRTGTSHILAISGYNVTIVAQGLLLVCLSVMERRRAVWLAVAGIAVFALLTGASASVVRAAVMGSIVLVAQAWGRQARAGALILVAAAVMVLFNPYLLRHDIGFQLSFLAVAGLVYIEPLLERLVVPSKSWRGFWQMGCATAAALAATLPLTLYYFGTLPVYALAVNVVILPLVPYAMALGALAGLTALLVPPLAILAGLPAWAVSTAQIAVVRGAAALPGAALRVPFPAWAVIVVYGIMIFGIRRLASHAQPVHAEAL